ncbi:MAG TPA: hypothetical protein VIY96_04940 [Thermoanaerobaculia bacterium]
MRKPIAVVAGLLLCAVGLGAEQSLYQIDLIPSGKLVSQDAPTLKGTNYLCHQYPTGTLISVRKSTVKQITKMSAAQIAAASPTRPVPMRDLPFQGPKQDYSSGRSGSGGRYTRIDSARSARADANAGTAARTASPD